MGCMGMSYLCDPQKNATDPNNASPETRPGLIRLLRCAGRLLPVGDDLRPVGRRGHRVVRLLCVLVLFV